jgi:hypothetical protein
MVNSANQQVECQIAVPDSFFLLDVKFESDRVLVAAFAESEISGQSPSYFSEFWLFAAANTTQPVIRFADRKTLLSRRSTYGESSTQYAYSVNCREATAVYAAGWEWGTTELFNASGEHIPLDRDSLAKACGYIPDYVWPVAWIYKDRRPFLIIEVIDSEGGSTVGEERSTLVQFDLIERAVVALSQSAQLSKLQLEILHCGMWQRQ